MKMNLPNKITIGRAVIIPFYVALMYLNTPWALPAAGALFIIASLSDTADGYIARKNNLVTDFGKFADPLADKILVLSAVCMFLEKGLVPAWSLIILIFRELAVTGFRCIAASKNRVLAADVYGKLKTITQLIALSTMHFLTLLGFLYIPCFVLYYISVALTVLSGCNYIFKNLDILREEA